MQVDQILSGYKLTEVGIIPSDWDVVKLGDILKIRHGKSQHQIVNFDGKYPILATGGEIGRTNTFLYDKPSVLIGRKGTIDVPQYIETPFWTIDTLFYTEIFNQAFPKFIFYEFNLINWYSYNEATGVPSLNTSTIHNIQIPLPPIEEQKRIAQVLSDIDELIRSLDELIIKKRNIKQGTMQLLLTGKQRLPGYSGEWEVVKLGDIGECIIGLTYKPEDVKESGLLVLRSSNIRGNSLKFDDNVFVNKTVPEKLITKAGDILICVRNGSKELIGKSAMINKKSEKMTFGAFMSVYRSQYSDFIFHIFQSNLIKRQIQNNLGATINQITNKDLYSFVISLPPLEEQKAIARILSDMDEEIEVLEQKRNKYQDIKKGMMQELLTGKTRLV